VSFPALNFPAPSVNFTNMNRRSPTRIPLLTAFWTALVCLHAPRLWAEPTPAATATFNAYTQSIESRLAAQHRSSTNFLSISSDPQAFARFHNGEIILENLTSAHAETFGALLHHWRGTAFALGATVADFEHLLTNFNAYPKNFSPEVLQGSLTSQRDGHTFATMRVRQRHVITVLMDTAYDITFGQLDARHGYSISQSTRISELDPKTSLALTPGEEHGFLWRLNTYWSYEERDGGLYLQIESVSLTRSIPTGLGWALRPYIESIPRESLDFTLRSAITAIQKGPR
jgi:hypothetical protein